MGKWTLGVVLLSVGMTGCWAPEDPPDFVTPLGVKVWVYGRPVSEAEVDQAFTEILSEFRARWTEGDTHEAVRTARVSFLNQDEYVLNGTKVAGNVSSSGDWIYVGAATQPVHRTALAHELVHYFDLRTHGHTDSSHESWAGPVYEGIQRVNDALEARQREITALTDERNSPSTP